MPPNQAQNVEAGLGVYQQWACTWKLDSLFVKPCQQGDAAKLRNCQLDNLRLNLLEDAASSICLRDPHRQEQTKFKRWKTCQVSYV
jgi:hypothetical protein